METLCAFVDVHTNQVAAIQQMDIDLAYSWVGVYTLIDVANFNPIPVLWDIYDSATNTFSPPPPPPPPTPQEIIDSLEQTCTIRRLRECVLGIDGGWMEDLEAQIETQRALIPPPT